MHHRSRPDQLKRSQIVAHALVMQPKVNGFPGVHGKLLRLPTGSSGVPSTILLGITGLVGAPEEPRKGAARNPCRSTLKQSGTSATQEPSRYDALAGVPAQVRPAAR
jgi:hypothetical protein